MHLSALCHEQHEIYVPIPLFADKKFFLSFKTVH